MDTRNKRLAEAFSVDNRINHLQEECAELICILNHYRRGRVKEGKVADEMADVMVLIEQVSYRLGISKEQIHGRMEYKLERTYGREELEADKRAVQS